MDIEQLLHNADYWYGTWESLKGEPVANLTDKAWALQEAMNLLHMQSDCPWETLGILAAAYREKCEECNRLRNMMGQSLVLKTRLVNPTASPCPIHGPADCCDCEDKTGGHD